MEESTEDRINSNGDDCDPLNRFRITKQYTTEDVIKRNGDGHQNAYGRKLNEIRLSAVSEPISEAISAPGMLVRAAPPLRQTIYPAREVDLKPGRLDPRLVAFHDFDPKAIAPFNRLVISLVSAAASRKLNRVLIASAQNGDGRTTVTLNLAAALARARQRVLVVESDFLRPSALRLLGVDSGTGLAEAIVKGLAPSQAMVWLEPIGFNLLPTRAQVENSAELLASPFFEVMMRTLSPEFDFILFDSAPLLVAADARLLELHTDATLLVIRQGRTSTSQMSKAIALLNEERLLGAVFNRVAN